MQQSPHTIYVLFNPVNRQFVGFSYSPVVTSSKLLVREVTVVEPINVSTVKWKGDYDTGSLVNSLAEEKTDIFETVLQEQKYETLFRTNPVYKIVEMLVCQMARWREEKIVPEAAFLPPVNQLLDLYLKVESKYLNDISFYTNSPDHNLITKEQQQANARTAFTVVPQPPSNK